MSNTAKVYMNSENNNNVMYLPLDKILAQSSQNTLSDADEAAAARRRGNTDSGGRSRASNGSTTSLDANPRDREALRRGRDIR